MSIDIRLQYLSDKSYKRLSARLCLQTVDMVINMWAEIESYCQTDQKQEGWVNELRQEAIEKMIHCKDLLIAN